MSEIKGDIVEILSMNPTEDIKINIKWIISEFSTLEEKIYSPLISSPKCAGTQWHIQLHPHLKVDSEENLALYLSLASSNRTNEKAKFSFSLLTSSSKKTNTLNSHEFRTYKPNSSAKSWGYEEFLKRDLLMKESTTLLPNDQLTVCCEIVFKASHEILHISSDLYQSELVNDLKKLLADENLCDITFVADGKEIKAHKSILAARSPVFAAMFNHEWSEQQKNVIEIDDVDHQTLSCMLQFIYSGSIANLSATKELLAAANKYGIESLKDFCEQRLVLDLTVETVCEIFIAADRLNATKLREFAMNFINTNASEVIQTDGWKELCKTHSQLVVEIFNEYFASTILFD